MGTGAHCQMCPDGLRGQVTCPGFALQCRTSLLASAGAHEARSGQGLASSEYSSRAGPWPSTLPAASPCLPLNRGENRASESGRNAPGNRGAEATQAPNADARLATHLPGC